MGENRKASTYDLCRGRIPPAESTSLGQDMETNPQRFPRILRLATVKANTESSCDSRFVAINKCEQRKYMNNDRLQSTNPSPGVRLGRGIAHANLQDSFGSLNRTSRDRPAMKNAAFRRIRRIKLSRKYRSISTSSMSISERNASSFTVEAQSANVKRTKDPRKSHLAQA